MMNIYLDIETIPDQNPKAFETILAETKANFKAPSDLTKERAAADMRITDKDEIKYTSKAAMIERWEREMATEKAVETADNKYRKTALNGGYGQVCVIGYAIDDEEPQTLYIDGEHITNETDLLLAFNDRLKNQMTGQPRSGIRIIGHNIEFDMRFLFHRFVVNQIKPKINLQYSRYSENTADTMQMWAGMGNRISLAELCAILDIPSPKDGIDGSKVWDFVKDGKINEVAAYCARDVAATREAYRRLTFTKPTEAQRLEIESL